MRNKSSTVQVVLGNGLHQKLIITPMQWSAKKRLVGVARYETKSYLCISLESNSAAMPAPTLEFASICLQNALFLLPSPLALAAAHGLSPIDNDEGGKEAGGDLPIITALPGPPIKGDSILDLRSVYSSKLKIFKTL